MGVETPGHRAQVQKAVNAMADSIRKVHESVCPTDATPLNPTTGRCPTCEYRRPSTTVQSDKKSAPTPDEAKQAELRDQFYARLARQRQEREAEFLRREKPKPRNESSNLIEAVKRHIGPGGRALY